MCMCVQVLMEARVVGSPGTGVTAGGCELLKVVLEIKFSPPGRATCSEVLTYLSSPFCSIIIFILAWDFFFITGLYYSFKKKKDQIYKP